MPRLARLDAPGVLHHIMGRGIERRRIFINKKDRNDFISRLAELAEGDAMDIYAWALFPNHFLCGALYKKWLNSAHTYTIRAPSSYSSARRFRKSSRSVLFLKTLVGSIPRPMIPRNAGQGARGIKSRLPGHAPNFTTVKRVSQLHSETTSPIPDLQA